MTTSDYPWEPPLAGPEVEHVAGSLDRLRTTFRWKTSGLDSAGLHTRIPSSELTLGGLLKHLAAVEDHVFATRMTGVRLGEPWSSGDWANDADWDFNSAANDSAEDLYALWDGAVERSRAKFADALANGGLDQLVHLTAPDGQHASLRRLVFDLLEEYGRHTGHADLIRESIDGLVGEDPPAGWHA